MYASQQLTFQATPMDGEFDHDVWVGRHNRDISIRIITTTLTWFVGLGAYLAGVLGTDHIIGLTLTDVSMVVLALLSIPVQKRSRTAKRFTFVSVADQILLIMGYTSVIYWLGGIDATFLTPIYGGFIMYTGVVGTIKKPYFFATSCSVGFALIVFLQHFGVLQSRSISRSEALPFNHQIAITITVIWLLFLLACVATLLRNLIAENHRQMNDQRAALKRVTEQAVNSDRLKTLFLANMSHELRTPMTHIIGFSELLLDKRSGELSEIQRDHQLQIQKSGRHLLGIIEELLDISTIDAGKVELDRARINPRYFIEECCQYIAADAKNKGIEIVTNLSDSPVATYADYRRLTQVVLNILTNAVKFSETGGTISITARSSMLNNTTPALEIAVKDTGIGIHPEQLELIFNAFERANQKKSSGTTGTGLGLAISKRLVELHGGRLSAESDGPGKGSTFRIRLPIHT